MKDISKFAGTICAGLAIAGVGLTGYLSGRAAIKAKEMPIPEDETNTEKALRLLKVYGPPVFSGLVTSGLIVASDRFHVSKEMVLSAGAIGISCKDQLGEVFLGRKDGTKNGTDDTEEHRIPYNDCPGNDLLVYEPYTDQYIWTSSEQLAWALLKANEKLTKDYDCRIGYFAQLLGGRSKPDGNKYGWNWENEFQSSQWAYYGGPWITPQPDLRQIGHHKVLYLFYQVEPETQNPSDMTYREGN